jgi:RHS repeat-associated protein
MKHLARIFVLMIVFGLGVSVASAQVTTGTPPFGSFSGGPDVVNNANLNAHWTFPIIHKPGRGTDFNYALGYDTSVWYPVGASGHQNWQPLASLGWPAAANGLTGMVANSFTYSQTVYNCGYGGNQEIITTYTYSNWIYTDPYGAPHAFSGSASFTVYSGCGGNSTSTSYLSATAYDGSGYSIFVSPDTSGPCSPCTVSTRTGTFFNVTADGSGQQTLTDPNGNTASENNLQFTDTLGQTALTVAGQAPNPVTFTYPYRKPDGTTGSAAYTINYKTYTVRTGFGCSGISEYGPFSRTLVDTIQLPNGKKYSFQYELTPNQTTYPGDVTARLAKVTLPTGGSISYTYTGANDGVNCADGSTLNLTRTVSDGVTSNSWTYARTLANGSNPATTTMTAPQLPYDTAANQTVLSFDANNHETSRKVYQGSATGNPLRTVNTSWTSNNAPTPATQVTILENTQQQQEIDTNYDVYGDLLQSSEYDWGTGTRGTLIRQTITTLVNDSNYTARGLVSLVARQVVEDGSGAVKSRVDFGYDDPAHETTCRSTPVAGHNDANFGCSFHYRGNPTSVTTYTDPVTPAGATTRYTSYDQLGNVVSADLSCCQMKTWSYSTATDYAYPDSVTSGSSSPTLTTSATYDLNLGLVVTSTNENGQISTFTYDSMGRVTDVKRPDNQHITYTYDDTNLIVQANSPVQGANQVVSKSYLDGLGRIIKTQLLDASNNSYSIAETKYDTQGRAYETSNPHNSTAQYWTETRLDALGRVVKTILPDSGHSTTTVAYSLNTATTTDPAGKQSKAQADGLGRMTAVFEPDVANGNTLTQQTSYAYDLLNNLTLVTQGGQTRTYIYDALGRLISSTTPEGGMLCFGTRSGSTCNADGYDSYNNLLKRTDARGVVTTYGYDTLNRPTSLSYNVTGATNVPATSTVTLTYGVDSSCNSGHGAGCIGRPITVTDGMGSENYTYNNLGQLTQLQKLVGSTTYAVGYLYNLAGELTQITYPSGRAVQQNVDTIGRLSSVVGTLNSVNTTYASGYAYTDAQQLKGFNYGNGINVAFGYSADRLQLNCLDYSTTNRNGTCVHDATTKFGLNYSYPASPANNGQIAAITDSVDAGRGATYTYDALYRLTAAITTGSTGYPKWGLSETYDRYGNRTAQSTITGQGCVPPMNCPTNSVSVGSTTNRITGSPYAYDLAGNMTNDGLNTIIYDAENRVTNSTNGSSSGAYAYDGNGLRVKKCIPNCTSPTTTTIYIYSGHQVIAAYDNGAAVGSPTREYIYGGRQRLAKIEASSTVYYHHDHLSVRLTTDSSGNTVNQKGHFPFGESWYQTGTASTNMVFTSYERDSESGNDYALAREYVNRLGRFSSLDPLSGNISDPQSLNRYTYSRNDPIDLLDPEGEYDCSAGGCDFDGGGYNCDPFNICMDPSFGGMFSASTPGQTYSYGTNANLAAMAGAGSRFGSYDNWLEHCFFFAAKNGWNPCDNPEALGPPLDMLAQADSADQSGSTGGAGGGTANKAQAKCSAKIQAAVQSDLKPPLLINLGPTSGPGMDTNGMRGGAFNVNFFESGVPLGPPGTATAIPGTTCGRFNDGLHVPIPGAPGCPNLNDPTIFTGQPAVYNGASGFFFTAHIDSGNANTFLGALKHFFIDVIGGNLGFHHGC